MSIDNTTREWSTSACPSKVLMLSERFGYYHVSVTVCNCPISQGKQEFLYHRRNFTSMKSYFRRAINNKRLWIIGRNTIDRINIFKLWWLTAFQQPGKKNSMTQQYPFTPCIDQLKVEIRTKGFNKDSGNLHAIRRKVMQLNCQWGISWYW